MRFLELHFEVTGEVPDPTPAMMERCGVCTEKNYLGYCSHCDKKVCTECKESHLDIMKREISRINNQVRRGLSRLQDALEQAGKSSQQLQTNCKAILEEIEEIFRRLHKSLRDREDTLKTEVQTFLQNELRNAESLKENLDTEVSNIESNCDLVEKHVTENSEWEDVELMEYKDTFLKTLEFLRNFDPDTTDFNRRLKFQLKPEPETVYQTVNTIGDVTISAPNFPGSCVTSTVGTVSSVGNMLMRSKSEHRLASSQPQQRHDTYLGIGQRVGGGHSSDTECRDGRSSPLSRRRTGDLSEATHQIRRGLGDRTREYDDGERSYTTRHRYGRDHTESRWQREEEYGTTYRSRFSRESTDLQRDGSENDVFGSRSVRFARQQQEQTHEGTIRERVLETEDATRGPLSGICRLMDSPRVMERLQQQEQRQKVQQSKPQPPPQPPAVVSQVPQPAPVPRARTARQVSEEDEISKQKAQNKKEAQQTSTAASTTPVQPVTTVTSSPPAPPESPTRLPSRRSGPIQREESVTRSQNQTTEERTDLEGFRRRYPVRTEDNDVSSRRPASRQMSRDTSETVEEVTRPPSRQTSTVESRETSSNTDKSTASSESSSKEDDSPQTTNRRRFFTRSQNERPSLLKGNANASIAESKSDSDSESEAKTPTPQVASNLGRQASLEDITGQEKPNYFRYRTAAYSRSPSNSSINSLDEAGRSGAPSPTSSQPPQFSRMKPSGTTSRTAEEVAKDHSKSTDSSSSTTSDSSSTTSPSRTQAASSTAASSSSTVTERKDDRNRYGPYRNTTSTVEIDKKEPARDDNRPSLSSSRMPSLASVGRTTSLDQRSAEVSSTKPQDSSGTRPRFVSRFLPRTSSLSADRHASDSSSSDSDDDDNSKEQPRRMGRDVDGSSTISALLARSANARKDNTPTPGSTRDRGDSQYGSGRSTYARDREEASNSRRTGMGSGSSSSYLHGREDYKKDADLSEGRYSSLASKYLTRSRPSLCDEDRDDSKYGGSYASRYLSKSKSSAALSFDKDDPDESSSRRTNLVGGSTNNSDRVKKDSRYGGGTAASRRSRLSRSKSSHDVNGGEDDDDDDPREKDRDVTYGSTYRTSRIERPLDYAISRSRSHHHLNSRDPSPEETNSSSALSSWARYLKNKYGNKDKEKEYQPIGRSRSSHALYSREASSESSEEEGGADIHDSTRRDSTVSYSPGYGGLNSSRGNENPRSAYQQKRNVVMKIGMRGSAPGCFTWPRGIAVGPDNNIVVADSSNHRVQIFDAQGSFCKEFGAYGSADGEFDCLAGVAVNRIGQYIISDRYNHRIQVFDPSGRFLRSFGSQGSIDGKLSYPWGIATDSLGFIYVCDKENHRVQVFQSDGTFVGKFGTLGSKAGQLEHPHYIAVSNTNKVIVSDSNNHRIQIFDVNGRLLYSFGAEGTDEGQFKFPRGVAVDDQGYIIVGDSGNNRIQVFQPDGTFLKAFGTWGSGDGEFKGLEGVAVTSNGNILVCDRENHRIQIF